MANMYEEMYDEFYSMICPSCRENSVDVEEEVCTHCLLEEMSVMYNEDIALEMSLSLDY
jgi:hypothetical protein